MDKNIKLVNPQKFDVGIKTIDKPMGINVKAGSFILVSEDDVNYISSISNIIQRGLLRIENAAGSKEDRAAEMIEELGVDKTSANFYDDDDIRKVLGGSAKKLAEWLDSIEQAYIFDRVYDLAMQMSEKMTAPKLKVLKEKMPSKDFIGE